MHFSTEQNQQNTERPFLRDRIEPLTETMQQFFLPVHKARMQTLKMLGVNFSFNDLRSHVDQIFEIHLRNVKDPVTHAWSCGRQAVKLDALGDRMQSNDEARHHLPGDLLYFAVCIVDAHLSLSFHVSRVLNSEVRVEGRVRRAWIWNLQEALLSFLSYIGFLQTKKLCSL
ncbi:unnamed protein product [Gongylonema pulchrum]|uniref:Uncharacterized protein n=1 Tax=Gongylonema pulchrum TaxID=637853 RepID=A0A183DK45_9BILA|nr:unnamed protein product [Gongylonema pulchrum]